MDHNAFSEIYNALFSLIDGLSDNYKIVLYEGKMDGGTIKCIVITVNNQNYLQIDSDGFINYNELFPQTKHIIPTYHCSPDKVGLYSLY